MKVTWDPSLEIGIAHLDEQHRRFISILNDLYDAVDKNEGHKVLGDAVHKLVCYSVLHFTAEHTLMEIKGDPNRFTHSQLHMEFQKTVSDYVARLMEGDTSFAKEVAIFTHHWLLEHIVKVDSSMKGL